MIQLNNRLVMASKLHNKTYRMGILLDPKGPEQYWVEKKGYAQAQPSQSDSDGQPSSSFFIDEAFYPEPEKLQPLLDIVKIKSTSWEKDKTEGLVYIYYRPKGLAQETSLFFLRSDNRAEWELYLDPVEKSFRVIKK